MEQNECRQADLHVVIRVISYLSIVQLGINIFSHFVKYNTAYSFRGYFDWGGLIASELLTILNIVLYATVLAKRKVSLYLLPISITLSAIFLFFPNIAATSLVNNLILCGCLFIRKDGVSGWSVLKNR